MVQLSKQDPYLWSAKNVKILLPVGNINKSNIMNILGCLSVLDCLGLNLENIKNYFKKNKL